MVKKVHYTWKDVEHMIVTLNNLIFFSGLSFIRWKPLSAQISFVSELLLRISKQKYTELSIGLISSIHRLI